MGASEFALDPSGALFCERERALLVADLHLEKGSSFARRGALLPPYDTVATLAKLGAAILRYAPRVVVAMGDSFHDRHASERLSGHDRDALRALQAGRDWVWIAGNHDPAPPETVGGLAVAHWRLGPVTLRHAPSAGSFGEIAGHLHPAAVVLGTSGTVRRRCFVSDGERCIMPAFGAYAGGLNVLDRAFAPFFAAGSRVAHALGRDRVFAIAEARLLPGR